MTVIEYEDDIMIIDMGVQFPEENMPGIDYIIPNVEYLKDKTANIKGVVITHGHYDHYAGFGEFHRVQHNVNVYGLKDTLDYILDYLYFLKN